MVTEALEIERKYDIDEPTRPRLEGLPGVAAVEGPRRLSLNAVYYDTDDLRLARTAVTLRRRTGGHDAGWHLKLPGMDADSRIEVRLPAGSPKAVPAELADLVLARTRGAPLRPVGRLRTARTEWRLLDGDGEALAEVVSDEVSAETLGDAAEPTRMRWQELEVELVGGARELLDAVEARLGESGARPSDAKSKIGRLLGDRIAGDSRAGRPSGRTPSGGEVVLGYLTTQVRNIVRYDPSVRRDEPDAVHKMRVAARRARSTLQAFKGLLDSERADRLIGELRWLGTVLADARDAEVQRDELVQRLRALPPELVVGPAISRVDSHFTRLYAEARGQLLEQLRGQRYLDLLDELHASLDESLLTDRAARPAGKVLPRQVGRAQRRVRRAIERYAALSAAADGADAASEADAALHEARKAAKRTRYAAEVCAPIAGKAADRTAKRMQAVQELLGEHQDSVVARGVLRDLGMQAHLDGENAFSYGVLLGQQLERAQRLRAELPRVWGRAESRKVRRWTR